MAKVPNIAVAPRSATYLEQAVTTGGGEIVPVDRAEGLVWTHAADPGSLADVLDAHPGVAWVQLPWAGIEPYVDLVRSHPERVWSCAKGVYSEPVAEHALALALAGRRCLDLYTRRDGWSGQAGENLLGARVTVVGGGGIARSFLRLVGPFGCEVTVVKNTPEDLEGADRVVGADNLDKALVDADLAVLALPLVPGTRGLIDRRRLDLLAPGAGLVNVARGEHVVTDDLVPALDNGPLGHAGLDVTDPEPLPDDHPLWKCAEVIITPHTGNTQEMAVPLLGGRVRENVRRYAAGTDLLGLVDATLGY